MSISTWNRQLHTSNLPFMDFTPKPPRFLSFALTELPCIGLDASWCPSAPYCHNIEALDVLLVMHNPSMCDTRVTPVTPSQTWDMPFLSHNTYWQPIWYCRLEKIHIIYNSVEAFFLIGLFNHQKGVKCQISLPKWCLKIESYTTF